MAIGIKFIERLKIYHIFLIILILISNTSFSSQNEIPIKNLLSKYKLTRASVGVTILNAKSGDIVYRYNGEKNYNPASNTKILTAAAALESLGDSFQFQTSIYYDQILNNNRLNNLYIDLSGDPSFTSKHFLFMLRKLKRMGVRSINHIYVINKFFVGRDYPINFSQSSRFFYYGAPTSIFNMNENTMVFSIESYRDKFKIIQLSEPKTEIINNLKVINDSNFNLCQFNGKVTTNNIVDFQGCMPKGKYQLRVAVGSPKEMMMNYMFNTLKSLNIQVHSHYTILTKLPEKVTLLTRHKSAVLSIMLKHMMLDSDNLYAQTYTRMLGFQNNDVGSIISGKNAILKIINKSLDLNTRNIQLEDGAGMSENDLMSSDFLSGILYQTIQNPFGVTFESLLPIYGISGTLKHRKERDLIGVVIAKTGTSTTTAALSGFITAKDGKKYIFSILVANVTENEKHFIEKFQDDILKEVIYL